MADSDYDLVIRVLRGEKSLYGVLVEKYQKAVYAVAFSYLRNSEDARDLSQDVFIRAYEQLDTLNDPRKFGPWISRITSRLAIDRLRVRKTSLALPEIGPVDETMSHNPGTAMTEEDRIALIQRLARIRELILQLPDYYRVAFVLKYLEGLSNKEIAKFLEVPLSTVEGRLHKAREFLRENIDVDF